MNVLFILTNAIISLFVGFAMGRLGDKYVGHLNTLHHWVAGLILIVVGIIAIINWWGISLLFLGIGSFISDLKDFLHMRIWRPDELHKWKFWDIS